MKVIGIIAEYNPFHLGHEYQIKKIKELYPESIIIAIISTHFTQRGDISIINKWDKTEICLTEGIDMVVELPTIYATQSADRFAYGALAILNKFKIDTLVFGSESNNIEELVSLAKTQINNHEYDNKVKEYLNLGINYPTAMSKALEEMTNIKIDTPNDLLALSYIKEIIKNNYPITPVSIERTNNYHGKEINDEKIISANLIRKLISEKKDISNYIPEITSKYINYNLSLNNAYNYLIYNIINNRDNLKLFLDVDEGLDGRILKKIEMSSSWNQLVMNIKSKRYTYNKINRMLVHLLLNIKKSDNNNEIYLRILGFNQKGKKYLNKIKKNIDLPIHTNYKKGLDKNMDIEYYTTYIYGIITDNLEILKKEKEKPIIY